MSRSKKIAVENQNLLLGRHGVEALLSIVEGFAGRQLSEPVRECVHREIDAHGETLRVAFALAMNSRTDTRSDRMRVDFEKALASLLATARLALQGEKHSRRDLVLSADDDSHQLAQFLGLEWGYFRGNSLSRKVIRKVSATHAEALQRLAER